MKLKDILKEIGGEGDYGPKPTLKRSDKDGARYEFDIASRNYAVNIVKGRTKSGFGTFDVLFGILNQNGEIDTETDKVNDYENLLKVLGSVAQAIKMEMENYEEETGAEVRRLLINPSRRKIKNKYGQEIEDPTDTRRENLYKNYVQKKFPGSVPIGTGHEIQFILPSKH